MKNLKIMVVLEITGDQDDEDTVRADVYSRLQELMDSEELQYDVSEEDDE